MADDYRSTFTVPADHPSLPGHFPGAPVVAGVLIMDLALQASEAWLQRDVQVTELRRVKFHSPLLPGERAEVALSLDGNALGFRVTRGDTLIAQGTAMIAPVPSP